jgi:hypothetical protein
MAIQEVRVGEISEVVRGFEELLRSEEFVFRGQADASFRLCSTFARYSTSRLSELHGLAFDHLIERFMHGLASIGVK